MAVTTLRATELAVMLEWQYNDCQGTAIRQLLTSTERRNLENGTLVWRSLDILTIKPLTENNSSQEGSSKENDENMHKSYKEVLEKGRKRFNETDENAHPSKVSKN
ncbi:hypothetical protein OESDEN_19182 [Oesophagostomum dentatum]|uniref:Uncharacterized protein n=1 Tax=Oesophagostomum dentatum TaxID=61180 RepID=A0A0B1SCB2_OESDE|nr:hypothetical protein OESDEN_19182 [Oesophagostomum dentatum]